MKLLSVKILGDNFRSLAANKPFHFNYSFREDRLSTKIFAGLNGSGKSNFLELFSEIFYFLEICHLNTVPQSEKETKAFGFEIEYLIPKTIDDIKNLFEEDFNETVEDYIKSNFPLTKLSREQFEKKYYREIEALESVEVEKASKLLLKDDYAHVRITKQLGREPEYCIIPQDAPTTTRVLTKKTKHILPSKIIAYTSGQNELLSNPFFKIRYHYFKNLEKGNKATELNSLENDRLFFLDYSSNFSIFVSNLLLANPEKLKYLKRFFKVEDLHSFRITLNLVDYRKQKIKLNERIISNIDKLKKCSSSWIERKIGKEEILILDYKVNNATHDAFSFFFGSSFELFKVFYELENLNLNLVPSDTRGLIMKAHKSLNLSDEMPKPDPSRLFFRIEKIILDKVIEEGKPVKQIYYKGLSDGEHQFNEVIGSVMMMEQDGCLFLMDEPDTHFNPKWRAKMIEMLNYVSAYRFDSKGKPETVRKQEIIITTHSPFVISDSFKEDIYIFEKGDYHNPDLQTYGGSIGMILETVFDRDISISDFSNDDLNELKESIKTKEDIQRVKKALLKFGESVEKFDAYSFLQLKEEELQNGQSL